MFGRLKLKNRLLVGYAIPVLFYLGLASLVYGTTQEVQRVQQATINSQKLAINAQAMIRSSRGYLAVENPQFLKEFEEFSQDFDEASAILSQYIRNEQQQGRFDQMVAFKQEYEGFAERLHVLIEQNQREAAVELFNTGNGTQFVIGFDDINREFNDSEEKLLRENLSRLVSLLIIGTVLMIALAAIVAAWIASDVTKTIDRATQAIASSSTEIAATIEQQERTASQQSSSVNETTTTMDELGASSRQVAEQAEAAVLGAKQALALTQGGTQAVDSTLEGMEKLKEKVGAIAQQIVLLSEQTGQIGSISALVSDLANQTNMLALNAAVEAVRAGDHGKGFAVVASEIRKLADQSKKSAEKIKALVNEIQGAINSTVMVTEEGTKTVDTSVQIAQKSADAFNGVANAVNDVVLNNQQISLNIKQQAIAIQQVVEAMNNINQGARETANGISQTKVGTQKLNEAALDLKTII